MELPQYITIEEVQRVCSELSFRDWTKLTSIEVLPEEARVLQAEVGSEALQIPLDEFRKGLEVELEHGTRDPQTNVTNDDMVLTGKIALAHLKEVPDYYSRLEKMEAAAYAYWEAKGAGV